ncbi:DUF2553 family protein [Pontibacillus yanchengensis]|uniref:DUF2553 family protein n=2 Tax=Pontibacillus yanchengensis TaxID=462910 RepID=A0ACC7VFN0_9BACI|nr:DUF2553 family protein [Pontibacillus yanchengensis]MYL32445.1 DUF2553 family protein [Pontibacillus yanchengensis]MYL53026.1 DUF2553 family protein [Pontibacillus yanchengensis]
MTERIDITDKVCGKICDDGIELFFYSDKIGEVMYSDKNKEYVLFAGYIRENSRIYKIEPKREPVTQFVEDCDLGWC